MLREIEAPGTKYCSGCKEVHPLDRFSPDRHLRHGVSHYCRESKQSRVTPATRAANARLERARARRNPEAVARSNLKLSGMTPETYDALLQSQNGVCAICRQAETSRHWGGTLRRLAVDHCHTTGVIRGLLCARCNMGLGYFSESRERMQAAIAYIGVAR